MDNQHLFHDFEALLRLDSRYCMEDGTLIKNKIVEDALALHPQIIQHLLSHPVLKAQFFTDVAGTLVFDKVKFQRFVSNKSFLADSFTAFKNRVGLTTDDGRFISDSREVVLSWPYKDCLLEGGQTKEDAKRDEIFWNETLAPEEVNRLKEPKVMSHFRLYDRDGDHPVEQLSLADNLVVKGNNLLALYSLKQTAWAGKIKMIYIDPPYNTGDDGFGYNDRFNHSTWLTFMKNRLEVARDLLSLDGVICVQCSFHEYAYLKALMDEVFAKCLCTFNIQVRHPDRILTGDKEFNDVMEYCLIYSKNSSGKMPKRIVPKTDDDYILSIEETGKPTKIAFGDKEVEVFTPDKYIIRRTEPSADNFKSISVRGSIREKNSSGRLYVKYIEPIMGDFPPETLIKVPNMGDDKHGFRYFYTAPEGNKNGGYYQGKPKSSDVTEKPYANFYNFEQEYNNVSNEGGVSFRNGKKPEAYLSFLISIFTKENDRVLDFHLGSGTTAAVAHKLGRHYIGIEQLDYGENDSTVRMKNVINGDSTGISRSVGWQGGGSFVYCELAKSNMAFADEIRQAKDTDALKEIWQRMEATAYLNYRVDPQTINESAADFEVLTLDEQKQFLTECLDKNLLYVPLSDLDSDEYGVTQEDKRLTREFYRKN